MIAVLLLIAMFAPITAALLTIRIQMEETM